MAAYKWTMKHASMILFVTALAMFFIGIGHALLSLNNGTETTIGEQVISSNLTSLLIFSSAVFSALSSAAVPLIGAVAIDRWDQNRKRG